MPYLIVKDRDDTIFEGKVDNISSYNKVGLFDVLLDHSNFICVIEKKIIVIQNGAETQIPVENGLLKVRENNIYIYLGVK